MAATPFHVIIIGGGIGGLCLAQGLKQSGISVAVYERDRTRTDRLQGYRIHINPVGSRALHECLPVDLYDTFAATTGKSGSGFNFYSEQLHQLLTIDTDNPDATPDPVNSHKSVSRITLRQALLAGLEDVTHFDKRFTRYENVPDGTVVAHFEDGTTATGTVLVAADGANSRVRAQYLPQAERVETGILTVIGKAPLTAEVRALLPARLFDGPASIMAPRGRMMFIAVQEFRHTPERGAAIGGDDDIAALYPGLLFDNTTDYVMWAFGAKREKWPVIGDLEAMDGSALQRVILDLAQGWHPSLRRLIKASDPFAMVPTPIRTSMPVPQWESTCVTLLGDAIHSMTPFRGIGANIALRDAAILRRELVAAGGGDKVLLIAIHDYETAMVEYGFAAVRDSLKAAKQAVMDNPVSLAMMKTAFRIMNVLPPVKRRVFSDMGNA